MVNPATRFLKVLKDDIKVDAVDLSVGRRSSDTPDPALFDLCVSRGVDVARAKAIELLLKGGKSNALRAIYFINKHMETL